MCSGSDELSVLPAQHLLLLIQSPGLHVLVSVHQAPERLSISSKSLPGVIFKDCAKTQSLESKFMNVLVWHFHVSYIAYFSIYKMDNFLFFKNTARML